MGIKRFVLCVMLSMAGCYSFYEVNDDSRDTALEQIEDSDSEFLDSEQGGDSDGTWIWIVRQKTALILLRWSPLELSVPRSKMACCGCGLIVVAQTSYVLASAGGVCEATTVNVVMSFRTVPLMIRVGSIICVWKKTV